MYLGGHLHGEEDESMHGEECGGLGWRLHSKENGVFGGHQHGEEGVKEWCLELRRRCSCGYHRQKRPRRLYTDEVKRGSACETDGLYRSREWTRNGNGAEPRDMFEAT